MTKIKIVTDSTVDLSQELLDQYGIEVVPLSIYINGQSYLDRRDISPKEFIDLMSSSDELPKSSQPSTGLLVEKYDELADLGYDIISIHMTGGMSGTVESAKYASSLSKANVTVIDSQYISKGLSFQVIEAAKMANEGYKLQEIIERITEIKKQTRLYVVVDTLENLIKGGRIGKGKAFIGSLLNIKPIASLADGVYTPVAKVRSRQQAIKFLVNALKEDTAGKKIKGVGITHADSLEFAEKLKKAVESQTDFHHVEVDYTTPVISTHTGKGAIGFSYYME